ncbi:hypothetical protein [Pseudonocardia sp. DLS-67]
MTGLRRPVFGDAAWVPVVDTAQRAFVPARLHDDLRRASDPDLPWPAARERWSAEPVPVTHLLWWPAAVAGAVAGIVPGGVVVPAAGDLLRVVAAALAVRIVLGVTARQRARAYRAPWAR